jgi:hypothetical protein
VAVGIRALAVQIKSAGRQMRLKEGFSFGFLSTTTTTMSPGIVPH